MLHSRDMKMKTQTKTTLKTAGDQVGNGRDGRTRDGLKKIWNMFLEFHGPHPLKNYFQF